jgi:ADP-heptose:LPS heptosyltransferase
MQDVIINCENQYKILLLEEEERNRNFRCAFNSKDNVINMGKMKLQQELAISNLDVMVSMDSGNAHIAAMLG